jgi:isocitrate lyase
LIKVGNFISTFDNFERCLFFCPSIAVEKGINNASSIGNKSAAYQHYLSASAGKSNSEAREIAKDIIGESVFWDWDRKL